MIRIFLRFFLPMLLLLAAMYYGLSKTHELGELKNALLSGQKELEVRKTHIVDVLSPLVANSLWVSRVSAFGKDLSGTSSKKTLANDLIYLARTQAYFEQLGVMDTSGTERLRVNYYDDSIGVVDQGNLSEKRLRDYFKKAREPDRGEVYLIPLELNKEYPPAGRPYHAVMRIISVLTDAETQARQGYLVTNIFIDRLVGGFSTSPSKETGSFFLVNNKGEGTLVKEGGLKYGPVGRVLPGLLKDSLPQLWDRIQEKDEGYERTSGGIYVYQTLDLAEELEKVMSSGGFKFYSPDDSNIRLIYFVPFQHPVFWGRLNRESWWLIGSMLLLFILISTILTSKQRVEEKMYSKITDLNDELIKSQYALNADRQKLSETVGELTRRNFQLKEFSGIISHNIRSPISGLTLLVDYLFDDEKGLNEDEKEELKGKLKHSVKSLNNLTEDLIDTVKVLDSRDLEVEKINLADMIHKVRDILIDKVIESNVTIHQDLKGWQQVEYHRIYLESILFNLMSNAIHYRFEERPLEIKIITEMEKNRQVLKFSDNGKGINLKWHGENIFGLHKTFHRNLSGKGFGLYMTRTQIESMGGNIRVESEEGVGTTFIITF